MTTLFKPRENTGIAGGGPLVITTPFEAVELFATDGLIPFVVLATSSLVSFPEKNLNGAITGAGPPKTKRKYA